MSGYRYAQAIIRHLVHQGVRCAVFASGSRSVLLAHAASFEEQLHKVMHFDERGAAFYAYGYAKSSQTPVLLFVTSGTAVANLFPAVMESSLQQVPLIIITADRPHEARDCGFNQICDQVKIFGSYVRWYFEMPCYEAELSEGFIGSTLAYAVYRATRIPQGPVHLNCLFREPFSFFHAHEEMVPSTHYESVPSIPLTSTLERLATKLSSHKRGVILVGGLKTADSFNSIYQLSMQLDWPILSDITSGMRSSGEHPSLIPYYHHLLREGLLSAPDCILQLGDRLISKQVAHWIERSRPLTYLMVADHPYRFDPLHRLTDRIECNPHLFCELLLPLIPKRSSWLDQWRTFSEVVKNSISSYLPLHSEPGIIHFLQKYLPAHFLLFIANSMPIRDAESFFFPSASKGPIFCNRGSSGIDGNIATAVGLAEGTQQPLLAIVGDLATLHDLNSFALLKRATVPVVVLIINNRGGGIFSFLPYAKEKKFLEEYVVYDHEWEFAAGAKLFDIPYLFLPDLLPLHALFKEEKTAIVEWQGHRETNQLLHQYLDEEIGKMIQEKRESLILKRSTRELHLFCTDSRS